MIWYVYLNGNIVGTVIASTEPDALAHAREKFGGIWGDAIEVKPRSS